MRKVERVGAMPPDDVTARDFGCAVGIELVQHTERVDDRQRVVGQKLAAQLVARKGVAIDQCDRVAAPRQERSQRRSAGTGTDDRDICVDLRHLRMKTLSADYADVRRFLYSRSPKRNGTILTTSTRPAPVFSPTALASGVV